MALSLKGSLNGTPMKDDDKSWVLVGSSGAKEWYEEAVVCGVGTKWSKVRQHWEEEAVSELCTASTKFMEMQSELISNSVKKHQGTEGFLGPKDDDEEALFREAKDEDYKDQLISGLESHLSSPSTAIVTTTTTVDLIDPRGRDSKTTMTTSVSTSTVHTRLPPGTPVPGGSTSPKMCDFDEENLATIYCKECEEHFCDPCDQLLHSRKKTRDHHREPLNTTVQHLSFFSDKPLKPSKSDDMSRITPTDITPPSMKSQTIKPSPTTPSVLSSTSTPTTPIPIPVVSQTSSLKPSASFTGTGFEGTQSSTSVLTTTTMGSSGTINVTNISTTNNITLNITPHVTRSKEEDDSEEPKSTPHFGRASTEASLHHKSFKGSFTNSATKTKTEPVKSSGGFFDRLFGDSSSKSPTPAQPQGKQLYIIRRSSTDGIVKEEKIPLPSWEEVRQYSLRLKSLLKNHQSNIEKLLMEQTKMQIEMGEELERWRQFAIEDLQAMGTAWHTARLDHMSGLLDIEWQYSELLTSRINKIGLILDNNKGWETLGRDLNAKGKLLSLSEIEQAPWIKSEQLEKSQIRCGEMAEKIRQLGFAYHGIQKKALRAETFIERTKRIKYLINKGIETQPPTRKPQDKYFHIYDPTIQAEFRAAMTDERTSEGQLIKKWRELLNETGAENVSAEAVETFIQHLVVDILKRYQLKRDQDTIIPCLRLYVDRLIFPHIPDVLTSLDTPRERHGDLVMQLKCKWIMKLTQSQLGIEDDFTLPLDLDPKELPPHLRATRPKWLRIAYGHAIESLARLKGECVPSDIFQRILDCVRSIYETATFYYYCHRPEKKPVSIPPVVSQSVPTPVSPSSSFPRSSSTTSETSSPVEISSDSSSPPPSSKPTSNLTIALQKQKQTSTPGLSRASTVSSTSSTPPSKSQIPSPSSSPNLTYVPPPKPTPTHSMRDQLIISADSLFPIVVWVVTQSGLDNLNRCVGLLERFIPAKQKNFGEMGMSLTLIEAALMHVSSMKPEQFGLPPEIEGELPRLEESKPKSESTKKSTKDSIKTKPKTLIRDHVEQIVQTQRAINETVGALL